MPIPIINSSLIKFFLKYFDNYLVEYTTDKNEKRYHHFDTYDEVLENLDGLAEAHNDYRHKLGFKEEK